MASFLGGAQIRQTFLDFFAARGHKILPSASLVPEDPTVLLTIAGMLPFKPIFLGQQAAEFPRATTSQKCIRTNDIENVGRTARHHTFFEMLGNFSFGDYFKEQAIAYAWELSTQAFALPPERVVVSVFEEDDEAFAIWRDQIGVPITHIKRMGADDNFWVSGPTGPCGPCSELYYDFHPELGADNIDLEDDTRFIEFYNLVFMQYNRDGSGKLTPLQNKNIDTGMGLERMAQILQKVPNNYETDLIFPIIKTAADLAGIDYFESNEKTKISLKVIGDHVRSVVHMIADGITASNTGRGYVLRRLIRRMVRHGQLIGIEGTFIAKVAETAIALSESVYPNVRQKADFIKAELEREEAQFLKTLGRGEQLLSEVMSNQQLSVLRAIGEGVNKARQISGKDTFAFSNLSSLQSSELTEPLRAIGEGINKARQISGKDTFAFSNLSSLQSSELTESLRAIGEGINKARQISDKGIAFPHIANSQSSELTESLRVIGECIDKARQISGRDAFTLYDTHGFPLELTQEIAEEQALTVDVEGFKSEMEQQRDRGRGAHAIIDLTAQGALSQLAEQLTPTQFLGYTEPSTASKVAAILVDGKSVEVAEAGNLVQLALDQTPFYAESGGQVGDRGYISGENLLVRIEDVKKESGLFIHSGRIERGTLNLGDAVTAQIDRACRRRAQANHTATHLLQAALKKLINESIGQAGSLVAFDKLRFDYNFTRGLTAEELQRIEDQINTWIAEAHDTHTDEMPIAEAKAKGAVAMFGEKYGAEVRVIDVPGVSMELCGGTHVNNTAEIGLFKIVSETGVAAGVRRIEAVAGPAVLEYLNVRDAVVRELGDRFKAKPEELTERVTNLQSELKSTQKQLEALKSELALVKSTQLLSQADTIGDFKLIVAELEGVDPVSLQAAAERLLQKLGEGAVVLGSSPEAQKVTLVAAFSPSVIQKGLQAGTFIGGIAKICGGGGGGRPNLAQAGGRDPDKLPEALAAAKQQLTNGLG